MTSDLFASIQLQSIHALPHRVQVQDTAERPDQDWTAPGFEEFVERVVGARQVGSPVVVFLGSAVLQNGLQPYLIELLNAGWLTHIAVTGAGCEYDLDAAMTGATDIEEHLGPNLCNLGMWQEIGDVTHRALGEGSPSGKGYGQCVAEYLEQHPEDFPYRNKSLLYHAYQKGIPYTVHITVGLDETHVHPEVDYATLGGASGTDFKLFCRSITELEHGVFMNIGTTVTGVEVFLKALSIARNLRYTVKDITTANFDVVHLGDYHKKVGYEDWEYYYRPRKNVVHRPTSLGGKGFHFEGEHQATLPALWARLMARIGD